MNPQVLYEDDVLLVINKPAGLMVHNDGRREERTLADWILERYPTLQEVGEPWIDERGKHIWRPGIVHRLDRETSGVLLIAKTQEMFVHLKCQFQERMVHKEYRAIVHGLVKEDAGVIDKPIGRSPKDFRRRSAQPGARGVLRAAVTEFRVIRRAGQASYLALFPRTGRTHQLRVHLKAIHHPIVCDRLYAPKRPCLFGLGRVALHAYQIAICDMDGGRRTFSAPLPNDMEMALAEMDKL